MNNPAATTVLPAEHLVIINSNLRVWSGTVKVERDQDLPDVDKDKMPPKALMSDGRKVLVDPKELAGMESVRKAIERFLKAEGFSFAGTGIAVSSDRAKDFIDALPGFEGDFQQALDKLIARLPEAYQEQEEKFPDWAFILAQARPTEMQVRNRCKFGISIFRMAAPDGDNPGSLANQHYREMAEQALPDMLQSIQDGAEKLLTKVKGKSKLLQSQLDGIRKLVRKLKAFAFLHPDVGPAADSLQDVLDHMPAQGTLNMTNTYTAVSVLTELANPHQLLAKGKALLQDYLAEAKQTSVQPELAIPAMPEEAADTTEVAPAVVPTNTAPRLGRRRCLTVTL